MIQPPDGYELWSPKKGDVYPQGYLYGGDYGYQWTTGNYPGRHIQDDLRGYFCRPKLEPEIKADPNPPQKELTMDKAFITKRPQYSDLLALSLSVYEVSEHVQDFADQTNPADVVLYAEAIDALIDILRETADQVLFTGHKETSDVK